jgi:hypothetical protein
MFLPLLSCCLYPPRRIRHDRHLRRAHAGVETSKYQNLVPAIIWVGHLFAGVL